MIQKATGVTSAVVNREIVIESGAPTSACRERILRPRPLKNQLELE